MAEQREAKQLLAKHYGWTDLWNDPWHNARSYLTWLREAWAKDETRAFAATVCSKGSFYLAATFSRILQKQFDWSRTRSKTILKILQSQADIHVFMRRHGVNNTGYNQHFTDYRKPLDDSYVGVLLLFDKPLTLLCQQTFAMVRAILANDEQLRRNYNPSVDNYMVSESPELQRAWRDIAPDEELPDKSNEFERLWGELEQGQASLKGNERLVYEYLSGMARGQSEVGAAFDKVFAQYEKLATANIDGKLPNYLSVVLKNDKRDEMKTERRRAKKTQYIDEPDEAEIHREFEIEDNPLLINRWAESPETILIQGEAGLSDLGLQLDKLTAREQLTLDDYLEGLRQGYSQSSKTGLSFRQFWGDEYPRKSKALERTFKKLRNLRAS